MYENIHWLIGGIPKKDDKLLLSKKYFKKINTEQWHEWNDEKDKKDIIKMLPHHRLVNCGFLTDNRKYPGKLFELNNTKYILYYSSDRKFDGIGIYESIDLLNSYVLSNYKKYEELDGYIILEKR